MLDAYIAPLLLATLGQSSAPATDTCAWDASILDPAAIPQPVEVFEGADSVTVGELLEAAGPAYDVISSGIDSKWMRWRVSDGREFILLADSPCARPGRAHFRGVKSIPTEPGSPEDVVREFYRWVLAPTWDRVATPPYQPVEHLLGRALLDALHAQLAFEQACARAAPPNMKPHMIEGNPFNMGEGASQLESSSQRIAGTHARVDITLSLDGYQEGYRWAERALLSREAGRWVIVDVRWDEGVRSNAGGVAKLLNEFADGRCW